MTDRYDAPTLARHLDDMAKCGDFTHGVGRLLALCADCLRDYERLRARVAELESALVDLLDDMGSGRQVCQAAKEGALMVLALTPPAETASRPASLPQAPKPDQTA
jgi:hypothetical protein